MAGNLNQNKASLAEMYQHEVTGIVVLCVFGFVFTTFLVYYEYESDNGGSRATRAIDEYGNKLGTFSKTFISQPKAQEE